MIRQIRLKNFAIFENLSLELQPGLNVFTGETGAGKSLVVDAITFLCGRRADPNFIRQGESRAWIEAELEIPHPKVLDEFLLNEGMEPTDEGILILRREFRRKGSGRTFINDSPVPVAHLKRVSAQVMELHGQHESQRLFDSAWHRRWLDRWGALDEKITAVAEAATSAIEANQEFLDFQSRIRDQDALRERLDRTIKEIEQISPKVGERKKLDRERNRLRHAELWESSLRKALEVLSDSQNAAISQVLVAERAMQNLSTLEPELQSVLERLESSRIELEDLADTLRSYQSSISDEPGRLEEVESRRAAIDDLCLRYGKNIKEVLEAYESAKQSLAELEDSGNRAAIYRERVEASFQSWQSKARALKAARKKTIPKLVKAVHQEFKNLALELATFEVRLETPQGGHALTALPEAPEVHRCGSETVKFYLAANPGEPPKPIQKVASGGELSRIMLSLHLAFGDQAAHALIFDEIDVGVGGATADAIGQRLARLGQQHQILLVTHQPQVAAYANHHHLVSKSVISGRTLAQAVTLNTKEKTDELARMLGGEGVTQASRRNAEALLQAAGTSRGSK